MVVNLADFFFIHCLLINIISICHKMGSAWQACFHFPFPQATALQWSCLQRDQRLFHLLLRFQPDAFAEVWPDAL